MYSAITYRKGNKSNMVSEFIKLSDARRLKFKTVNLDNPDKLEVDKILAVQFADGGAQGDPGAVNILYNSIKGVCILYGNYAYGDLDLDAVIRKLPMLEGVDGRDSHIPPYPFGKTIHLPVGWGYLYLRSMNHLFLRDQIIDAAEGFFDEFIKYPRYKTRAFYAIAWFCNALKPKFRFSK